MQPYSQSQNTLLKRKKSEAQEPQKSEKYESTACKEWMVSGIEGDREGMLEP